MFRRIWEALRYAVSGSFRGAFNLAGTLFGGGFVWAVSTVTGIDLPNVWYYQAAASLCTAWIILVVGRFVLHLCRLHDTWRVQLHKFGRLMSTVSVLIVVAGVLFVAGFGCIALAFFKISASNSRLQGSERDIARGLETLGQKLTLHEKNIALKNQQNSITIDNVENEIHSIDGRVSQLFMKSDTVDNKLAVSAKNDSHFQEQINSLKFDRDKQSSIINMLENLNNLLLVRGKIATVQEKIDRENKEQIAILEKLKKSGIEEAPPAAMTRASTHEAALNSFSHDIQNIVGFYFGQNQQDFYKTDPLGQIDKNIESVREEIRKIREGR